MSGSSPRVSVIMATYNSRNCIRESTEAVLNQSFNDLELLILDGGSTDGTIQSVKSINDERIKIFENAGDRVTARNHGIRRSTGEYIAIVDSDTAPNETHLENSVEFLDSNKNFSGVGSYMLNVNPDGSSWVNKNPISHTQIKRKLIYGNQISHSTLVARTSAIEEVGGYRHRQFEDYDLIIRLMKDHKLQNRPEVSVKSYVRKDSVTHSTSGVRKRFSALRCNLLAIKINDFRPHTKLYLVIKQIYKQILLPTYRNMS